MHISGQCHCGAISFTAEVDPAQVIACHCNDCQVISGAPFRAVLPVPVENVTLSGQPKAYVKIAASGNRRVQAFCGTCGAQLYSADAESAKVLVFRLGCINERAKLPPVVQIWGQSALPWLHALAAVPIHAQALTSPLLAEPR